MTNQPPPGGFTPEPAGAVPEPDLPAPKAVPDPAGSAPPRLSTGLVVTAAVLGALLLVSLCYGAVLLTVPTVLGGASGGDPTRAAEAAARRCVTRFLSVSVETVVRDQKRIEACSTGRFLREYRAGRARVRQAVEENEVQSTVRVRRTAVADANESSVDILLAADATTKNKRSPQGRRTYYRIEVEMRLVGGTWKLAKLKFVS